MATPLSPDQFARFQQHMARFPNQSACPICQQGQWGVVGLEVAAAPVAWQGTYIGPPLATMPLVVVMCTTCCHVRHFAWVPIRDGYV